MRDFYLKLKQEPAFAYGEKLYVVKMGQSQYIREKCPVCDDTGKIEIKGHRCRCPFCRDPYEHRDDLNIHHYEVVEYIINEVRIQGPEVKKVYEAGRIDWESNLPWATYYGFAKTNSRFNSVDRRSFFSSELFDELKEYSSQDKVVTKRKKLAEEACAKANAKEKEKLAEFNKTFGTAHPWPWKD